MVYLMLFSLFIGGPTMDDVYTIFTKGKLQMAPQYFHPQLDAIDPEIFIVTAQEGEHLKAVTYWHNKKNRYLFIFYGSLLFAQPAKKRLFWDAGTVCTR